MRANRECMIFGGMALRQQEEYDHHNVEKVGLVNFGTVPINYKLGQLAKHAFVFLIAGINDKFKIPVTYFLTSGLKSEEKAA